MLRTNFFYLLLSIIYLYNALPVLAQNTITKPIELKWTAGLLEIQLTEARHITTVGFVDAEYDYDKHVLPYFSTGVPVATGGKVTAKLRNSEYLPIILPDIVYINDIVQPFIVPTAQISYNKGTAYALVSLLPIRRNEQTGNYEKLIRADLEIQVTPADNEQSGLEKERSYADNSVLAQGTFYKFKTQETGIYRIDRNFLNALGITDAININNLRIYGNGGAMLPELAGADKFDDLVENPIKVIDQNNNGTFDNDDYALFYAQSPNTWTYNSTAARFEHQINYYTEYAYYFLNADIGAGKRVANMPNPSDAITDTVKVFDDYAFHETEKYNYTESGRLFLGEEFEYLLEQKFSFNFPNLHTATPVKVRASVAARCIDCISSFSASLNGSTPLFNALNLESVTGHYEGTYASTGIGVGAAISNSATTDITLQFNKNGNKNAAAWLNYLEVNAQRNLVFTSGQMPFRHANSVGEQKTSLFVFSDLNANAEIWDVSDISNIQRVTINNKTFSCNTKQLHEFIAFDNSQYLTPQAVGKIANQNLHAIVAPDMVIVAAPIFEEQANRLADFHRAADNLQVAVVTTEQVFNEFASGKPDPTAIRDLLKMYYDRANNNDNDMPQYLLLMGDASYDYKNIVYAETENTNFVPTYESTQSLVITATYATDDYFGYLDDTEGAESSMLNGSQKLDIAIGRMPVKNIAEAEAMVDKAIHYYAPETMGDWRTRVVFIGDDEDGNTHTQSANLHADYLMNTCQNCNVEKIFLDAYRQETTAGGSRYPQVNQAINRAMYAGALLINYEGHGGEKGWAEENILDIAQTRQWKNTDKMPLFITATCSFGRYENPRQTAIGELIVMQPKSGAIATLTTSRLVYSGSNATLNQKALNHLMEMDSNNRPHTIGEVFRLAKNDITSSTSSANENLHKFNLLGDPALRLPIPTQKIALTNTNEQALGATDTINALSLTTLKGEIQDPNNNLLSNFNGTATIAIYDKIITTNTLQNDVGSGTFNFQQRKGLLFRGKASVHNGKFSISFIAPRDIMLNYGKGRISAYAENGTIDAAGYNQEVVVGGILSNAKSDNDPPQVAVFMNDENFRFGGNTDPNPVIYIKVFDENGISTTGSAVGHDITAILDSDAQKSYLLNEYYEADINSYQSGIAKFPLYNLSEGRHYIDVKAWDTQNNSGKGYTEFVVASSAQLALYEVMSYPNPFSDETTIAFEHNRPNETLDVTVQIFSLSGQLQKTITQQITPVGFRTTDIKWDGTNDMGSSLDQGVYIYRVSIHSPTDNKTVCKSDRVVVVK